MVLVQVRQPPIAPPFVGESAELRRAQPVRGEKGLQRLGHCEVAEVEPDSNRDPSLCRRRHMGLGVSKRVGEWFLCQNAKAGSTCGGHLRVASTRRGAQECDVGFHAGRHLI